jgi:deoxyribonuclease V
MKIPRTPYPWSVSPKRAVEIQKILAPRVRVVKPRKRLRFAAGVDAAFMDDGPSVVAAAVVWDLENQAVIEERVAQRALTFPYVPGLLSFREAPAVLAALRKIRTSTDVILCDGHGLAHPRRFGLACHVGVLCDLPTVGCAKSLLVGEHRPLGARRGASTPLLHRGEIVGSVLRTQYGVRPVYVSVGNRVDLKTAERAVLRASVRFRLPEPIRRADQLAARVKKGRDKEYLF